MKKTKIYLYAHYQAPLKGASSTRMLSLAKHIQAECGGQYDVELVGSEMDSINLGCEVEGVKINRFYGRVPLLKWVFKECFGSNKPVFIVSSPPGTPAAEVAIIAKWMGSRVLVDVRDPFTVEAIKLNELDSSKLSTKIKVFLEKKMYKVADEISIVSDYLKQVLIDENYASKDKQFINAPNGFDKQYFRYDPESREASRKSFGFTENDTVFVYQGIIGGKGLDEVFTCFGNVAKTNKNAKLLIVAVKDKYSQNLIDEFQNSVISQNLSAQVQFLFNLSKVELNKVLNASDVGINPLPSNRMYCLPVKSYEYAATGLFNLAHGGKNSALDQLISKFSHNGGVCVYNWSDFEQKMDECCKSQIIKSGESRRVLSTSDAVSKATRELANSNITKWIKKEV